MGAQKALRFEQLTDDDSTEQWRADCGAVVDSLRWGRENALHIGMLARLTGINKRRVQEIIKHLIEVHEMQIGTGSSGVFFINTAQEEAEVLALHKGRALSELTRMAKLRRIGLRRQLEELQRSLFENGEG